MEPFITRDRRMLDLIQLAKTVAQSKATVLIQGESGTGKERLAEIVHRASNRSNRQMVAINCAAIPDNLLESELFGVERGAFTGAVRSRAGKFEMANGGTLLLDEVSEMDIRLQAKLLRAIQEGEIDRVGGSKTVKIDVRIIATTNKNLADCVAEGTFREDLYYRLNVVNLTIPPLRDRIGDIHAIAEHYLKEFAENNGKITARLTESTVALLNSHTWPGNVRELENTMERAVITAGPEGVTDRDIVIQSAEQSSQQGQLKTALTETGMETQWTPGTTLGDIERHIIIKALQYHHGNRTHTARALGISIRTLRNKLADYRRLGIQV